MLKNGLIGVSFLLAGLVLVFGGFHLYLMIVGGALILVAGVFLKRFQREMMRKTLEFTEKKRLEKIKNCE
jgi:hypothetical protein